MPVPLRLTLCGLPDALSETVSAAARLPVAPGVKLTLKLQLAPAATELPHVFVSAKSPALAPLTVTLVTLRAALPLLVSVTLFAELVIPTAWFPNDRLAGERFTADAVPVPLRLTV